MIRIRRLKAMSVNLSQKLRHASYAELEARGELGQSTLAIRAGQERTHQGEHSDPLFLTSSFVFKNAQQAADRFAEISPGNIYSRFTNPTVRAFENRLAALEHAQYCVATGSGMGAILLLCLALLKAGDEVVIARQVFGSTISLFENIFTRFQITPRYVDITDLASVESAISDNTRFIFLESPTNPLCEVADIVRISETASVNNCWLVVDNAFCTPALQQPLNLGADIVIHSATKYLDGQGRCVGGAVVTNNEEIHQALYKALRTAGPSMSPFNAWVFLSGLETLPLRMKAHCENAYQLATWLDAHPGIAKVYYPGLPSHPHYQLAKSQQQGFGGIVSFEIKGGKEAAWKVIDNTELLSITANLGDTKTTITHPASTTHFRIGEAQRKLAGISDELIRISVGLEDLEDVIQDVENGLVRAPLTKK